MIENPTIISSNPLTVFFFDPVLFAEGLRFRVACGHVEQRPTLEFGVSKKGTAERFVLFYVVPK